MRRISLLAAGILSIGLTVLAFGSLATAAPTVQEIEAPTVSGCESIMTKIVTPDRLLLGGTASVTMVMTHTCPGKQQPVDIMFLVDASNSMTRDSRGGIADPGDPGDPTDPPPMKTEPAKPLNVAGFDQALLESIAFGPDQDPGVPPPGTNPGPGASDDPPGCNRNDAIGPGGPGDPPGPNPPGPPPGPNPLAQSFGSLFAPDLRIGDTPFQEKTALPPPMKTSPPGRRFRQVSSLRRFHLARRLRFQQRIRTKARSGERKT